MTAPRLLFLYPRLLRSSCAQTLSPSTECLGPVSRPAKRAAFNTSARRGAPPPSQANQRYGTANEPLPQLNSKDGPPPPSMRKEPKPKKALPKPATVEEETRNNTPTVGKARKAPTASTESNNHESIEPTLVPAVSSDSARTPSLNAVTTVLHMEPPMTEDSSEDEKPPHLVPPPFVHHFDTYTLVNALQSDKAFTPAQSVTIMKGVRSLLAWNMDLARDGLVSKGDAEMASYQFRAASSELRTEIRQQRGTATERMRAERMLLQHEVDTIGQRLTQESLNLRDELKGMFDDRKMAVRMERRAVDGHIQELGYKITVAMNSGMRNEVEGLRFILTRRTVLALVGVVVMSLAALGLGRRQEEKKKKEEEREGISGLDEDLARRLEQGADPSLVTMG